MKRRAVISISNTILYTSNLGTQKLAVSSSLFVAPRYLEVVDLNATYSFPKDVFKVGRKALEPFTSYVGTPFSTFYMRLIHS